MDPINLPDRYLGNNLANHPEQPQLPNMPVNRAAADRLDLRFLMSIFRRRFRLFAMIVGAAILIAFLVTVKQPKLYKATADVVINKFKGEIVPNADTPQSDAPMRSEEVDTELKIIKSQEMAVQVIEMLHLEKDQAFVKSVTSGSGLTASVKNLLGITSSSRPDANLRRRLSDAMLFAIKADRLETAYAIRIIYTNTDPKRAAQIANAFAESYSGSAVRAKRAASEKTLAQLRTRIDELRILAQTDFGAVQDFRVRNNLLSTQATQLTEQEASAYGQQLANARAAAAADRGRANNAGGAGTAAAVNSPVIQSLRSQRAIISVKVADLSGRYLEGHPDLVTARRELADIDYQIGAEISRIKSGVTSGLTSIAQATAQQVGSLQLNLGAARAALAANNLALVGLDDLNRKAQASQNLYESYLSRYREVLAQAGTELPEARLLSAAKIPQLPSSPNLPLNLALGLVIGSLLGAASAIAAETAFSGLTTGDEVESRLGIRYLGGVPSLASVKVKGNDPAQAYIDDPASAYAEAIRGLLASVRQSKAGRSQVIAVTSALPGEGKTSLAASMARSAAFAGETVIVIDCDLIRRTLSSRFNADMARPGLREMIHGESKLGEAMVKDADSSAMILPITNAFSDNEKLLEKGNFHKLIAVLREHFSVIVLDLAPILPVAETREIISLADSVVIAALWRKTSDTAIRAALKLLPPHMFGNIGITLNQIDMKKQVKFGDGDASSYYDKYKNYYARH
jgi:polysaccharide biosynthesis transport protein